ncbi:hypothetical protein EYW49_15445 [Siculibacillus lacustris]|uniref:DUF2157 domain-containing protein n=1 Tax=Siculibacillus lacustris TaxID=1549641 RepID=A0A4Q9VKT0_9HYPH|nr:hypothetical protein [Siculibacillus lacustris]TBW35788.1 hypothetical protein EYW49_15445 [Siculibacillus lacustris]
MSDVRPGDGADRSDATTADLDAAVAAGIVSADQARRLGVFFAERRRGSDSVPMPADPSADEENVRFVTSFNDVFVTLGILLLVGAVAFLGAKTSLLVAATASVVVVWALSEVFSRHWRMAFPSIVLTAGLVGAGGIAGAQAAEAVGLGHGGGGIAAGVTAVALGFAHWRRFGVPISVAAAVAGAATTLFAVLHATVPTLVDRHPSPVMLVVGLAVFALAMRWDSSDRQRRTRRTDVAFWLHILAAPLIVHPLVSATGTALGDIRPDGAAIILALFAGLAFVALVVDRRALLVSGLIYLGATIGTLIERLGWAAASSGPLAAGAVGAVVLVLAIGWTPLRALALRLVPASLRALVPEPRSLHGRTP